MTHWGKISLLVAIGLSATILGVNNSEGLSHSTGTIIAKAAMVNVRDQGMVNDSQTPNNIAFQNILNKWNNRNLTVYIPKGTYLFDAGNIKLHSNITFKFAKGAIFEVRSGDNEVNFVYPSPKTGYNGGISNIKWENATFKGSNTAQDQSIFAQSIHHAKNITFNHCTFENAESPGGHYIDLDGSHTIKITNSKFIGFNPRSGQDYKEAIQIDYSNPSAMTYRNPGDQYDNLPTYDVKVNNSQFLPIYTTSGQILSYAPNPIGEHIFYNDGKSGIIHDIHFTNNTVVDPKPLMGNKNATIRFIDVSNLWIEHNTFTNLKVLSSGNYIYLNNLINNYKMNNLNIKNNTFNNISPNNQYIFLNSIHQKKAMTNVTITGNKIIDRKTNIPFVKENFPIRSAKIKISNNKTTIQAEK